MKMLVTSDWHMDAKTMGVERFTEIQIAVRHTVDVAIERDIDLYVFLGDLMDPDCGSISYRIIRYVLSVIKRLSDVGIASLWVAGNHDVMHDGHGTTTLSPIGGVESSLSSHLYPTDVRYASHPCEVIVHTRNGEQTRCVALPYPTDKSKLNVYKDICEGAVVFSHLNLEGMIPGEESHEMARGQDHYLPLRDMPTPRAIFNGHYHKAQSYALHGCPVVQIPGSLAKLTFGEQDHTPSFILAEV